MSRAESPQSRDLLRAADWSQVIGVQRVPLARFPLLPRDLRGFHPSQNVIQTPSWIMSHSSP